ncbi:hypothetical protein GCM10017786_15030 [Amycolatopsis deserti]|uniref:HTH luxR-type domain-containing protein n=1 Tax=Amycolatopsis deserti TaxID=185696 RepID=A0ABQ3IK94_9PSEU|nr:LuxR C-terminal-related transcriptional regulator [Amycolatopsis deserti]GHE84371.1 hypothetical protein GCM10017786_15030 [Amycolatopsis deserti]
MSRHAGATSDDKRHYERAFRVLEGVDDAPDLETFKSALVDTLAEVYHVRSTTFFVGRTAQLACADPAPTLIGFTRHLLPEYQERWFSSDIFGSAEAFRSLSTSRVATLAEINGEKPENRQYITNYLGRHGMHSAAAICLDVRGGRKALVGLFDHDPDRIGPGEMFSLRLLARPLNQIARHLPETSPETRSGHLQLKKLSPRQAEVARLVGEGFSNAAIGDILHLRPESVKKYVTRILAICGLSNRTELAIAVRGVAQTSSGTSA